MKKQDSLPYRPCAGAMVLNVDGLVWIGRRQFKTGAVVTDHAWQMPQGGIDKGEDPLVAARREVHEETGMTSLELLAEAPDWYSYDIPVDAVKKGAFKGKYRGQTQKWFAFRFTGRDDEINIHEPPDGSDVEFVEWRWERMDRLPGLIIPFKRPVYEQVVAAFEGLANV